MFSHHYALANNTHISIINIDRKINPYLRSLNSSVARQHYEIYIYINILKNIPQRGNHCLVSTLGLATIRSTRSPY